MDEKQIKRLTCHYAVTLIVDAMKAGWPFKKSDKNLLWSLSEEEETLMQTALEELIGELVIQGSYPRKAAEVSEENLLKNPTGLQTLSVSLVVVDCPGCERTLAARDGENNVCPICEHEFEIDYGTDPEAGEVTE